MINHKEKNQKVDHNSWQQIQRSLHTFALFYLLQFFYTFLPIFLYTHNTETQVPCWQRKAWAEVQRAGRTPPPPVQRPWCVVVWMAQAAATSDIQPLDLHCGPWTFPPGSAGSPGKSGKSGAIKRGYHQGGGRDSTLHWPPIHCILTKKTDLIQ